MTDVFLSYNREDQATAQTFAQAFEREGLEVWWDVTLRAGETYDEVTEAALRSARAVVVLWSKRSVASRWVRAEATLADRNKTLVPAMIEPCERPIMFELTQTADLSHWYGDGGDPAWRSFLADVRRRVDAEREVATPAGHESAPAAADETSRRREKQGDAPSLAVLPFANRSGLPEDDVFAVGMVEDIIHALSQGVNLRVIASAATARFRTGAIPDLAAMAKHLGVRYVMEGNIRRAGEVLRVTAQLVEAASGAILWTQKFERPLSELATLQEELILDVASHLDSHVYRVEMERSLRKPLDLTAWECVTRATAAFRQITNETLVQALAEAERAVEIAPDYGLAHAMRADAAATIYMWSHPYNVDEIRQIGGYIDRALALEPDNAMVLAHCAEAFNYIGQPENGLTCAERAIQLSPNYGLAHYAAGVACTMLNRTGNAIRHFDLELRAAPGAHTLFASFTWRGSAFVRAGNWEEAERAYAQATRLNPAAAASYLGESFAASFNGRSERAIQLMDKVRQLEPRVPLAAWELGMRRWFANCPSIDQLLTRIRDLWSEAEAFACKVPG